MKTNKIALIPLLLLVAASAILYDLSFPPVAIWPLSIFAHVFMAYLVGTQDLSKKESFWVFFSFAFVIRLAGLYWIPHTLIEFSDFPLLVAWALGLLGFVLMSLPSGLWGAFGGLLLKKAKIKKESFFGIFLLWILWDLLDLRLFGWIPAQSFGSQKQLLASAGVLGTHGWNLLFYALVAYSASLIIKCQKTHQERKAYAYSALSWVVALSIAALLGQQQIEKLKKKYSARQPVALLQGNVGNFEKKIQELNENPTHDVVLGIYRNLVESLALKRQSLGLGEIWVFWPETAFPGFPLNDSPLSELLSSWARITKGFHLVGAYEESAVQVGDKYDMLSFNIVAAYDSSGNFRGHYRKVERMPFGEYVPGDQFYPGIYQRFPFLNHFGGGEKHVSISHPAPDGPIFLPFICFEILKESYVREAVRAAEESYPGRDLILVNPTNDSWFGGGAELFLHSHLARWQVAREGLAFVRPTNTGISMVVAPWGEILAQGKINVDQLQLAEVPVTHQLPASSESPKK